MNKIQKAEKALSEACENKFLLHASIPVNPNRDHDILIGDALSAAKVFYAKIKLAAKEENWGKVVEALLEFEE